ncbi:MAG: PQQ-binding-like beta-propeller repeat protein [Phycisphaerales bacterium]
MFHHHHSLRAVVIALTTCATVPGIALAADSDWRSWRGPDGSGYVADSNPPIKWSAISNIKWKVAIPGSAHASPIVMGDRVYVMTAVEVEPAAGETPTAPEIQAQEQQEEPRGRGGRGGGRGGRGGAAAPKPQRFIVMALDRESGEVVWQTAVNEAAPHEGTHGTSTFAAGSPVTDGEFLYAFFGSYGIYCLDLDGTVMWHKDLGDMRIRGEFGEGASPAVHDGVVVVPWDHEGDSFIVALDASTGEEVWRRERDEPSSWATPIVVTIDDVEQVILPGTNATIGYNFKSGEEIWRCSGMTSNVIPTPIIDGNRLYLMSGFRGSSAQAINLEGATGDISGTAAVLWEFDRGTPYVPSPLLANGRLYFLRSNSGVISCLDAATGEPHYLGERLADAPNVYASLVGAGNAIYVCSREGEVVVIEDGPTPNILATNSLGEGINATPAIAGDELFIRTDHHLFCIAATEE